MFVYVQNMKNMSIYVVLNRCIKSVFLSCAKNRSPTFGFCLQTTCLVKTNLNIRCLRQNRMGYAHVLAYATGVGSAAHACPHASL